MRVNGLILTVIGVFFGIVAVFYWFTSYEDAGFLMLIGSALLGLLPGGYYLWWSSRMTPLEGVMMGTRFWAIRLSRITLAAPAVIHPAASSPKPCSRYNTG